MLELVKHVHMMDRLFILMNCTSPLKLLLLGLVELDILKHQQLLLMLQQVQTEKLLLHLPVLKMVL